MAKKENLESKIGETFDSITKTADASIGITEEAKGLEITEEVIVEATEKVEAPIVEEKVILEEKAPEATEEVEAPIVEETKAPVVEEVKAPELTEEQKSTQLGIDAAAELTKIANAGMVDKTKTKEFIEEQTKGTETKAPETTEETEDEEEIEETVIEPAIEENIVAKLQPLLKAANYYSFLVCGRHLKNGINLKSLKLFYAEFITYGCSNGIDYQVMEICKSVFKK